MSKHKGMSTPMQIVVALLLVMFTAGIIGGAVMWTQGSAAGDNADDSQPDDQSDKDPDPTAKFADRQVKLDIELKDLSGSQVTSKFLHVYEEKPDEWENEQTISDAYNTSEDSVYPIESDGITTIQETPGTYYVVSEVSDDYPEFFTVTIPDGSNIEATLSEYNQAPALKKFTSHDIHTLGSQTFDVGVDMNSSTTLDYSARNTYNPDRDTEYRLSHVVMQTGDNDPTTDSDSDGVYDEGITESYVEITGAVGQSSAEKDVYFKPGNGIDKLGAENKVTLNLGELTFDRDNPMTVEVGVKASSTEIDEAATDGDETFSDGENVWDINFCDVAGNCNSVADVQG